MPEIPHLQLAQLLAPQRVIQQCREAVTIRRRQQFTDLVVTKRRCFAFAALTPRPFDAFDRVMGNGVFLAEILKEGEESAARRCRTVAPPRSRRARSSRHAMTWARLTARNSSGRAMPVKPMKSSIAFS
jgi:hypothetical protein